MNKLVDELADLFLRSGSGRNAGLYYRVNSVIGGGRWDGQIDEDTLLITRVKEIIETLQRKGK